MDKYTTRSTDGSIDVAASANAYAKALTEWAAQNEIPSEEIETEVNAVLALNPTTRVPMPALLSAVANALGASAATHASISARVHEYIKGQVKAGNLFVLKGLGGGVTNVAPVKKTA
jgi:hypothetical protein